MERGLIMAFGAVILWGFLDAASRYAVVEMAADPWMFSCVNLFVGSMLMLLIAGRGHGRLNALYHVHTWVFGFFRVLMTLLLVFAFTQVSASEANFMLRVNVIMGLIAAYLIFKRTPQKSDIPGAILLIGGFIMLVTRQEDAFLNIAVILVMLAAVCDTVLTVIAESHPASNRASGIHARLHYTGIILLSSSFFFILIAVLLAYLKEETLIMESAGSMLSTILTKAPTFDSFTHTGTWISGIAVGLALRAPSMYLYLYAARLLKTESLLMAATLAPFATLGAEGLLVALNLIETPTLDMLDVTAGFIMTAGAMTMVFMRAHNAKKITVLAQNNAPLAEE